MKRWPVLHPFLFAAVPILFLFANNIAEVPTRDLWLPLFAAIIIALIVFFVSWFITRSWVKSGLITSWFLVLFFCYGYARDPLRELREGSFFDFSRPGFFGSVWVLLFAGISYLIIRAHRNFVTLTMFLNITATILVLISMVNIGIFEINTQDIKVINKEDTAVTLQKPAQPRDIYYIILDAYGRDDTLQNIYGYDNSEFISYLNSKGFYVAEKSRSNYSGTILSLPSSLNMNYLSFSDVYQDKYVSPLYNVLANNEVSQLLKSAGYKYIHVSSGWEINGISRYARVYPYIQMNKLNVRITSLTGYFIQSTALEPFLSPYIPAKSTDYVLNAFKYLANMPAVAGPKFVFSHISAPHPPWIFDREGNAPPPTDGVAEANIFKGIYAEPIPWYNKQRYIDQLVFINKKVEETIDAILAKSAVPPIIIIQGDHGPESYPYEEGVSIEEAMQRQRNERMSILNAYYFPDADNENNQLYESISPVNSFRVLFNEYFGTNYTLLPDTSYFLNFEMPRKFVIVPPVSGTD